jgi:hypothetical protein
MSRPGIASLWPMNRPTAKRSAASFIAWSSVSGRSREIADALGGDSKCFYDFGFVNPRLVPLRYLSSAVRTILYLALRRPRAVIASNPPIFPGLIAYLYSRVAGARVVLDSHPVSFGFDEEKKVVRLAMPLQRFLVPRVDATIVTVQSLIEIVNRQGGQAAIVHEADPDWTVSSAPAIAERATVLFVGIFAKDEPVHLVAESAWALPAVDILVTGDIRKCPPTLLSNRAPNLHYVGFLDQAAYLDAMAKANIVITLTERPEDVGRAASEAVSARRPLIVSDWPAARRYFPHAVAVPNTVDGVTSGIRDALRDYDRLVEVADLARQEQRQRWDEQLATLRALVGLN